ncbi:MAG: hypothetical protein H7X71_01710 [Chitinophagales bacterium]|nr:hypothetical protein [Chitinophagales bacterium]
MKKYPVITLAGNTAGKMFFMLTGDDNTIDKTTNVPYTMRQVKYLLTCTSDEEYFSFRKNRETTSRIIHAAILTISTARTGSLLPLNKSETGN